MKLYAAAILAAFTLAACDNEETPTAPPTSAIEAPPEIPVMGEEQRIVALGDSLFTGYGLDEGESYPAKLEVALRSRGINARIVNAGVSGDTTAAGRERLTFTLESQKRKPDLIVLSLGGNDMLRGLPPEQTRANLDTMLAELKRRDIPVLLLGMLAAPNLGEDYADRFNAIYPALAKKYDTALVPFFLQPLMDRPDLLQDDRIHPTAVGIEVLVTDTADEVAEALDR